MAKRITQDQIQTMIQLYSKLKTYSAVAKEMGISATTVSRYIKENDSTFVYSDAIAARHIEEISPESLTTFSNLSDEEQASFSAWLKEFGR